MRIVVACLLMLFPVLTFADNSATSLPKDKYLKCNCHITPGTPWKVTEATVHKAHVHHKAKGKPKPKIAEQTPPKPKAKHVAHHPVIHHQVLAGEGYPGKEGVITSNKLALPAGKSIYAPGELVYISGRVLDSHCVPVSDAIVDIWQANPEGKYTYASFGERLTPFPTFAGSGRATTDNLGRFNFVTVFPGTVGERAPFIHVRVVHKDFPTLDTEMFFADDRRNAADPVFSSLSPEQRNMVTAKVFERDIDNPDKGLAATWDISLNGKNLWRHF